MLGGWKERGRVDVGRLEGERGRVACSLEFMVNSTLHFVSLQTQVHVPVSSMVDIVLQWRGDEGLHCILN